MITCRELVAQLMEFLNKELTPELHQRLEEHLKQCPPCIAYVRTYEITVTISRTLPKSELPPEFGARLLAAMRCEKPDKSGDAMA